MAGEIVFAAPRAEEMTKAVVGGAGAGITGIVEGVMVKMAPQLGVAAPILTWGTLLGVPLVGSFGALFTRGMLADLCQGIAAGGVAIIGYSIPELVAPVTGRSPVGIGLTSGLKQLPAGMAGAPARAAAQASQARAGWVPEAIR